MTTSAPIAVMLAGRHALQKGNPDLLAWSKAQWQRWLPMGPTDSPDSGKHPAIIVARLTCLDDLPLHVGLMKILADDQIRAAVVLSFPTEAMARIARSQARREGWGVFVRMAADAQVASVFGRPWSDTLLVTFPVPTLVPSVMFDAPDADALMAAFRGLLSLDVRTLPPAVANDAGKQPPYGAVTATELFLHVSPSQLEAWMLSAFLNRGGAGNPVVRAFAQAVDCRIAYAEDEPDVLREIPVVWGVLRDSDRILAQAKAQSLYFFYIDHAYFARGHGQSYRITRNRYEAGPVRKCPSDRIQALDVEIRPWRKSGREIIVCPPTEYFMAAHGCPDWLETTLAAFANVTDRPIVVREKPKAGETAVTLAEALETAHALVTHSSNVAIEAACLGTPVFVAPASAAAPIGRTDLSQIENPAYPDRSEWLAHLAYNQFAFDEIQNGRAWKMLLELEERELV